MQAGKDSKLLCACDRWLEYWCRVTIRRASANLSKVDVLPVPGLNVYSILQREQLILTQAAATAAIEWLSRPINKRFGLEMASSGLPIPARHSGSAEEADRTQQQ